MREFTLSSVLLGVAIGIVFGIANAYLGLKVGMTVSTSIPTAILGIALYRIFRKRATILEANMVQTIASSSGSVAAGLIFTIPAFFLWGMDPGALKIFVMAIFGGWLGVLFMIPLRQFLIVREAANLPYPEGMACAEVLKASDEGGKRGNVLFKGLGVGALYQFLMAPQGLGLWPATAKWNLSLPKKGEFAMNATPELLGVGFIIGPRIAALMLAGGALGALVLVPLIALIGESNPEIAAMTASAIRSKYVRFIGVGAVGAAGFISLFRTLPVIWESFVVGLKGMRWSVASTKERTERDLSPRFIAITSFIIIVTMALLPDSILPVGFLGALCVFIFGFFFVTVSSRIVGLVGVSSNPTSGMTIATLLITAALFLALGLTKDLDAAKAAILLIGGMVCSAASNAGDTSQDLKTGYLVGATPYKQQIGEFIGVTSSALVLCFVIYLFREPIVQGILPAPQANLIAAVIDGVLSRNIPWDLVLLGVVLAVVVELLELPSLAFAIGLYLPFGLSTPIFVGGILRGWFEKRKSSAPRLEAGVLFSSGLIAGAALLGVGLMVFFALADASPAALKILSHLWDLTPIYPGGGYIPAHPASLPSLGNAGALICYLLLTLYLWRVCRHAPRLEP